MTRFSFATLILLFVFSCTAVRKTAIDTALYDKLADGRVKLPNSWKLTAAGYQHLPLGDLPLQIAVSKNNKYLAVTNNGAGDQKIQLFSMAGDQVVQTSEISIPKAWYGLEFSSDNMKLYASGGNDNTIVVYAIVNGQLKQDAILVMGESWPKQKICPTGISMDESVGRLLTVTKEDSALYVLKLSGEIEKRISLPGEAFDVLVSEKRNEIYVSLWGLKKVQVFDRQSFALKQELPVGDHPNEMILNKAQTLLYVANSLDNSVSVIDLNTKKTLEVLNAALYPDAPNGSTTNSLALSPTEHELYIANADNNCLAVYDVSEPGNSKPLGFIPTGWYPTSVRCIGNKILVANGKGMSSLPNPKGPSPLKSDILGETQVIKKLLLGTLSVIKTPEAGQWAAYSKLVYENCPYNKSKELFEKGEAGNPIPQKVGDPSPIKYVFYIIKENRTYDQVLGDMPDGNGDTSLCLFPEKVTPNQHALARGFVLLDNFYVDAEVSADGHNWSTAAYANDFVEKTWPTSYGGRGGNYDFEGSREVAFPKGGFIWDHCARAGVSYRTYGEFTYNFKASYKTLEDHFCEYYSGWDLDYQDIQREKDWEHDFDSLLNLDQVPRFNSIRFGNDHTSGMRKGAYSPIAAMADNDLAVGRFLEHLSHSKIWPQSAVFILEDDAQNGADHVDAHRSIAFVASPYTRRNFVDHTFYSTSSMMRTMELILGIPPMSQYDAAAVPMWRCFSDKADFSPIKAIEPGVPLDTRNAWVEPLSRISETWNLAELDAVPEREFNEVLWKAIKGLNSEMPAPRRAAWLAPDESEEEED